MKNIKQLLEDIQTVYAPKEISYKGYTTKNLHHSPDATRAFQATITRVEKGTLEDNGEVLDALKNTDTYMKLNDMHLEQEKDLDPKEFEQWQQSHAAAKEALEKIREFEHHYDYWNAHNTELQFLKANQNMPQETESVNIQEAGTRDELANRFQFTFNRTPAGKAREILRNREELKRKIKATKDRGGLAGPKGKLPEEVEIDEAVKRNLSGGSTVSHGTHGKGTVVMVARGGGSMVPKDSAIVKFSSGKKTVKIRDLTLHEDIELEETKTQNPYHAGYAAHGEQKTRQHNPYKEGSEGAAMWAKGWEHASDGKPKAKFTNENFGADFLAMAKERNPNARLVTPEQKRKEAADLMKKRANLKPAHAAPTSNPRPLGGYDPKSNRSYSEGVEHLDELSKETLTRYANTAASSARHNMAKTAGAKSSEEASKAGQTATKRLVGYHKALKKISQKNEDFDLDDLALEDIESFMQTEDYNQLDELSKNTLASYIKKRSNDVATQGALTRKHAMDAEAQKKEHGGYTTKAVRDLDDKANKAFMKGWKHRQNIGKAVDKLTKEEVELEEAVEVSHARYIRSHGKPASGGHGSWMFTHKSMGDVDYKNSSEVHSARGSFSDAKKSAQKWAKEQGHSRVYVMESVEIEDTNDE